MQFVVFKLHDLNDDWWEWHTYPSFEEAENAAKGMVGVNWTVTVLLQIKDYEVQK